MVVQPVNLVLFLAISSSLMTLGSAVYELVINVHANGTDQSSCLMSNSAKPCKSLWFILDTLTGQNSSQRISAETILINVASDQIISGRELQYYLDSSVNVTVSGIDRPSILCENRSSLTISTNKGVRVKWVWKEIAFYGCGFMEISQTRPGLLHKFFHSVQILNCSMVMQTQIQLDEIYQVTISNTEFVQDHSCVFPAILTINNTCACLSILQSTFTFANNSIMDYSCHGFEGDGLRGFLDIVSCFDNVLFIDNKFSNIFLTLQSPSPDQSPPPPLHGLILFRSSDFQYIIATSVNVSNNIFMNIHTDFVMVTPHLANECNFKINQFLNITSQFKLLNVSFCQKVSLHQNQFIKNNITDGLIEIMVATNEIIVDELTLVDNGCVFNLLSLDVFSDPRNVSIQHVHAEMNRISDSTDFIGSYQVFIFILTASELISMKNITFIDNHILIGRYTEKSALVLIDCDKCASSVTDASFSSNVGGTPLSINGYATELQDRLLIQLSGTLLFFNNTALYGGAFYFSCAAVEFLGNVNLTLIENSAEYGGAMYLNSIHFDKCDIGTLNVQNNTAKKPLYSENFMYFAEISSGQDISQCSPFLNYTDSLTSVVSNFSFLAESPNDELTIIPGQKIEFDVSITDFFGHSSSCKANVSLICNGSIIDCESRITTKFNESTEIVTITQDTGSKKTTVETGLVILLSEGNIINVSASLELACQLPSAAGVPASCRVPLNIKDCPLGFVSNPSRVCECSKISNNDTEFPCSIDDRAACVPKDFWYGNVHNTSDNTTVYVFARCSFPDCNHTRNSCLVVDGNKRTEFVLLKGTRSDADDQCSFGRGGVLCRGCRAGFVFTFTAVQCVKNSSECDEVVYPITIIAISMTFQVTFAVVLFCVVRFKVSSGSGFLYGPMLFLSVISDLQLNQYPVYEPLNMLISVLSSIPLLNLEVFGLIPWCFFHPFDKVYNYSLRYLGPLTVLMVILVITLIARWCPKALQCWQVSPVRPMCILLILSFWSLADTSVHILTPTFIKGIKTPFVSLQPELPYFSPLPHLLVAIPAILVLVVLITPLLFLLVFYPLLSKVVNLHRIKPFLDEFHSCYIDRFRWYSAVYFIAWIIIVIVERLSLVEDIDSGYLETATICIYGLLLFGQFLIRPYQSKILNMADVFLLVDIFILKLVCLVWRSKDTIANSTINIVCIHILVIGPILIITVWFSCALILKCGLYECFRNKQCIKRRQSTVGGENRPNMPQHHAAAQPAAQPSVSVRYIMEDGEREPLITIMDHQR